MSTWSSLYEAVSARPDAAASLAAVMWRAAADLPGIAAELTGNPMTIRVGRSAHIHVPNCSRHGFRAKVACNSAVNGGNKPSHLTYSVIKIGQPKPNGNLPLMSDTCAKVIQRREYQLAVNSPGSSNRRPNLHIQSPKKLRKIRWRWVLLLI